MALARLLPLLLVAVCHIAHAQQATNVDCFANPTSFACQTFTMPDEDIELDLSSLCTQMPTMVGCSLWTACGKSNGTGNLPFCTPMSLYSTICTEMGDMKDCTPWTQLCGTPGSVVQQCTTPGPTPGAPSTAQARQAVLAMCASHSMVGCDACTPRVCPHPMDTLSQLCLEMPGMPQCDGFVRMCSSSAGTTFTELCGTGNDTSSSSLPPMKMWMHAGIRDILLFKEWIPENDGQYAGYCILCIVWAVLVQGLKAWRVRLEGGWAIEEKLAMGCCGGARGGAGANGGGVRKSDEDSEGSSSAAASELAALPVATKNKWWRRQGRFVDRVPPYVVPTRRQAVRNAVRSVFTFVIVFLDYMLMLLVMSFNIGIIFSTVSGFALGAFMFGHWGEMIGGGGGGGGLVAGQVAPDSENDLEVGFFVATGGGGGCCANGGCGTERGGIV